MRVETKQDHEFLWGCLSALNILCVHDSAVEANDIVEAYTTIEELEAIAKAEGDEQELATIEWLKKYHQE